MLEDRVVDPYRPTVERAGRRIELTPKQFGILELLMRNIGIPLSRAQILEQVWGYGFETQESAIDVHIAGLRKKDRRALGGPVHQCHADRAERPDRLHLHQRPAVDRGVLEVESAPGCGSTFAVRLRRLCRPASP